MKTFIKIDPQKHMQRWYAVGIQSTLLEGLAVIYGWGSLRSSYQQWKRKLVGSQVEAEAIFNQMVASRLARGYTSAGQEMEGIIGHGDTGRGLRR
jgi:predicted DNA-binding WGR domain protein